MTRPGNMLSGTVFILLIAASMAVSAQSDGESAWLRFTENKQQWDAGILFKADMPYGHIFLEKDRVTMDMSSPEDLENIHYVKENSIPGDPEDLIIRKHAFSLQFEGANPDTRVNGKGMASDYSNFFIGNDPAKWATEVHHFEEVIWQGLYDKTDLHYSSSYTNPKYQFQLWPGADADNIQIRVEGIAIQLLEDGSLEYDMGFTKATEPAPIAWQMIKGEKQFVNCSFVVDAGQLIRFAFPDGYNQHYPLIIDPELVFVSYSGSTNDNWGYTATYDNDGHLYGGGIVFGSGYPTTLGAYDITFNAGEIDMGLTKFTPDGADLIWSTYLGGSGDDLPHSMVVNSLGELLVYGTSSSGDFPALADGYDNSFNGGPVVGLYGGYLSLSGVDIVISKISADGTTLSASTYVGGSSTDGLNLATATQYNYGDPARGEIFVDDVDKVYVASSTTSADFPMSASSYDDSYNGNQDGVIFCLSSDLQNLLWSTYIGGTAADGAYSIKISPDGSVAVAGGTASSGFPTTAGSWNETYLGGTTDGYVLRLSSDGSILLASTFVGTNQYDQTYFVEFDEDGDIYITGQTKGSFPVSPGVYSEAGGKQFIAKLPSDLSSTIFSTIFGSGSSAINISPSAFLVDNCEYIYVSGWGGSVNNGFNPATGNTSGMTVTADALDATTDGSDFYFFVLEKNAVSLIYASFFGGSPAEHVDGGTSRFDKEGTIYQAVCAGCGGSDAFPTTDGAWSEVNGAANCNLGVGKIAFNLSGVYAVSDAEPDIFGCAPFTVYFENLSSDADEYIWDFGDGLGTSTAFEPVYTYTEFGEYTVSLIVIDSSTCNIADTAYLLVTVFADSILASFDYETEQDCESLIATFTNTSDMLVGTTFIWDFGDGTTSTSPTPEHTYTVPGVYEVLLIINDPNSCNTSDTASITISFLSEFSEDYTVSSSGCLPVVATFSSEFIGADSYSWDFGGGVVFTGPDVIYTFNEVGSYTVILTVVACGVASVSNIPFNVYALPEAFFDSDPAVGLINIPLSFTNLSTNDVAWDWYFSDGGYSDLENPEYTFTGLGSYEVCLTATNIADCEDTYCRSVQIESEGVIGVPNAFSPNGDGSNDILFVRGFGIKTMRLEVFNRWGQMIFSTTDQSIGWDGSYAGVDQEMEVYIYTLVAEFYTGKRYEEQGDITLLR